MPPLPALAATATATDYFYNNNVTMISSSPHSSQKESPQSFTSELLRRINSQRSPAEPSTTTAAATAPVYDTNTVMPGQQESPATVTRNEEMSTNESSSSSSKKRTIITNSSSHQSTKRPRRSSRLKRQQPQDQCCDYKSDSEVEDENRLGDYEPDEEISTNQSSSFSSQISTKLTKYELRWESKFEELRVYKRSNGNVNIPRSNKQLGLWVMTQRTEYRNFKANKRSCMTLDRIAMLESIGFEWVPNQGGPRNESAWNKRFNELSDFKKVHGHTIVPTEWEENKQLGNWVNTQRKEYRKLKDNKHSCITKERIQTLESIGFEWVPNHGSKNESTWNKRFNELKAYKEKYGSTNVPKRWKENKELGQWVSTQRTEYKNFKKNGKAKITPERIQMLESIGFEWVSPNKGGGKKDESAWNKQFTELKNYKGKYGRTDVPQRCKDNKQLGKWVSHQRTEYKKFQENGKAKITPERIQMLESIDFEWVSPNKGGGKKDESAWNKQFTELKAYKEKYGRTNVSQRSKDNKELGKWVSTQRTEYKKFQENEKAYITKERINMLNSIGFQWECRSARAPRS